MPIEKNVFPKNRWNRNLAQLRHQLHKASYRKHLSDFKEKYKELEHTEQTDPRE